MIYIPCQHTRLHNGGGWKNSTSSSPDGEESAAIAPRMLACPTSGRVHSWLGTLAAILHRRIVHEAVLRQLLLRRYGAWIDYGSVGDLVRSLPVFYRHRSDRYFLLRDVIPFLPRMHRRAARRALHPFGKPVQAQATPALQFPGKSAAARLLRSSTLRSCDVRSRQG